MMRAIETKNALVNNILGPASSTEGFRVFGYKPETLGGEEISGTNRTVSVRYLEGDFSGPVYGNRFHDAVLEIELSVSGSAIGDLAILEDPAAGNEAAKMQALEDIHVASMTADEQTDDLISTIFDLVQSSRAEQLGLDLSAPPADYKIANRAIKKVGKADPFVNGSLVIISARMNITFRVTEIVEGEDGVQAESIKTSLEISDQDGNIDTAPAEIEIETQS